MRRCIYCKEYKLDERFSFKDKAKRYLKSYCKPCENKRRAERNRTKKKTDSFYVWQREREKKPSRRLWRRKWRLSRTGEVRLKTDTKMNWKIWEALKYDSCKKSGKYWQEIVGYTVKELREYLGSKFRPGMTWDNYGKLEGKWCLDHIIPKSSFDYRTMSDASFKECWRLDNLQPLWFWENCRKANLKYTKGKNRNGFSGLLE